MLLLNCCIICKQAFLTWTIIGLIPPRPPHCQRSQLIFPVRYNILVFRRGRVFTMVDALNYALNPRTGNTEVSGTQGNKMSTSQKHPWLDHSMEHVKLLVYFLNRYQSDALIEYRNKKYLIWKRKCIIAFFFRMFALLSVSAVAGRERHRNTWTNQNQAFSYRRAHAVCHFFLFSLSFYSGQLIEIWERFYQVSSSSLFNNLMQMYLERVPLREMK